MAFSPHFLLVQLDIAGPPTLAAKVLQMRRIPYTVVYANYPNAFACIEPAMFKGIIVFGAMVAAYEDDKYPWLKDLKRFVTQVVNDNVPMLGLCLGAQILANVVGGETFVGKKGMELGHPYDLDWTGHSDNDVFCDYIKTNELHKTLVYAHWDTFTLPQSGCYHTQKGDKLHVKLLATTRTPYNAIFKVGNLTYGFQSHPELDQELWNLWIFMEEKEIRAGGQDPDLLRKNMDKDKVRLERNGSMLLSRWFDLCLQPRVRSKL
eukprot:267631_1